MTLTTGLEWQEDWVRVNPHTNDTIKMIKTGHYIKYMMSRAGKQEPGKSFNYSTGDPMLLSGVLHKTTGMTAYEYAQNNLFEPIGMSNVEWDEDEEGYTITFSQLHATVRDYAKFGYLYLNKGRWEVQQIVSKAWVERSTRPDTSVNMWAGYGYLWHVNLPYRLQWNRSPVSLDTIPRDGYMAEGYLGQNIVIIPSRDLVIVRVANETSGHMDLVKFLAMIMEAIEN